MTPANCNVDFNWLAIYGNGDEPATDHERVVRLDTHRETAPRVIGYAENKRGHVTVVIRTDGFTGGCHRHESAGHIGSPDGLGDVAWSGGFCGPDKIVDLFDILAVLNTQRPTVGGR